MTRTLRRITTGLDAAGKSCVVEDVRIAASSVTSAFELWHHQPAAPEAGGPVPRTQNFYPLPGESVFRVVQLPAADAAFSAADVAMMAEGFFTGNNIPDCRIDTSRHPFMHRTPTLDYSMVLSGRLSLLLDEGELPLEPMDTVIQRKTNHFWLNTGSEPAYLLAVMIGARSLSPLED